MSAPHYETIISEQRGFVRWITLNRPEKRNAISPRMLVELDQELSSAASDPQVRVLAIAAAGKAFCAGADLSDSTDGNASGEDDTLNTATTLFNKLEDFPRPVVAVVQGVACAGGLELLLCCDVIIAAESARLADIHSNVGLIPGAGGAYRLVRRVGIGMAKWMLYSGDFFTATEMRDAGLVTTVVADDDLTAAAANLTIKLSEKSPLGLAAMKRLADQAFDSSRDAAMADGLRENVELMRSFDFSEGLRAMKEQRPAAFVGR